MPRRNWKWRDPFYHYPLFHLNYWDWKKPAIERPVAMGCVIQVDRDVEVVLHDRPGVHIHLPREANDD